MFDLISDLLSAKTVPSSMSVTTCHNANNSLNILSYQEKTLTLPSEMHIINK